MSKSNLIFATRETIGTTLEPGSSFNITTDNELNQTVELLNETSIELKNATQLERMTITATGGVATIIKRGLTQGNEPVEDVNLRKPWGDGATAYVTQLAFNIFDTESDNIIKNGKKLQFGSSDAYIFSDDNGANLKFKDGSNTEIDLSTISAAAGSDTKVAISTLDTTSSQLEDKLIAGDGISFTKVNPAGNEILDVDINLSDTTIFSDLGVASKAVKTDGSGNIFQATETVRGGVEMLTDSEALAGTDEIRYINSKQTQAVNKESIRTPTAIPVGDLTGSTSGNIQATQNGFIVLTITDTSATNAERGIYSDNTATPVKLIGSLELIPALDGGTVMIPVLKDNYYRVDVILASFAPNYKLVEFYPLG